MKYIIAALAFVGLVAVAEAEPRTTITLVYDDIPIITENTQGTVCLTEINGSNRKAYLTDCETMVRETIPKIRAKHPDVVFYVILNGVRINEI